MKPEPVGYLQKNTKEKYPSPDFSTLALTEGDRKAGWVERAVYINEEEDYE